MKSRMYQAFRHGACVSRCAKYEIVKSIETGNGIHSIDISKIIDLEGNAPKCPKVFLPIAGTVIMAIKTWPAGLRKLPKLLGDKALTVHSCRCMLPRAAKLIHWLVCFQRVQELSR